MISHHNTRVTAHKDRDVLLSLCRCARYAGNNHPDTNSGAARPGSQLARSLNEVEPCENMREALTDDGGTVLGIAT